MSREAPIREEEIESAQTARPETQEPGSAADEPRAGSFLFDDPYWDDAFDSYHDPTLRTCCRR